MVRTAIVVSMMIALPQPIHAHPSADPIIFVSGTSGSTLMNMCGNDWVAGKYDPCGAFITGVIDGVGIAGDRLCPPKADGVVNQMATVAYRAVKAHPERWHYPASWLIVQELEKHFGCKQT